MNAETIRDLLRRQPFQPFEIRMSNVEAHQVHHPENGWVAGNRMIVYYPATDRMVILSLLPAVSVEPLQVAA